MRKFIVILLSAGLILATSNVYAQQKGASEQAYEHASDEAVFHRVGDWFATIGKSKEEKQRIKAERKAERMEKKAEKKAKKKMKELEEEGGEKADEMNKKTKKMKKEHKGSKMEKKGS